MSDGQSNQLANMPDQAIQVITAPAAFFRDMPQTGGYVDPAVFLVVMGVVAALIQIVLGFIGLGEFGMMAAAATGFLAIFVLPLFMIFGGFIMAAIGFVVWRFLGSQRDFETAFRCVAYSSAIAPVVAIIGTVPYAGTIAHVAWGMFLVYLASIEVHGIKAQTAKILFGVIGAIMALMSVMSEHTARQFQEQAEIMQEQFQGTLQGMENKTPEEMGEALGEFLKGLEKASKQTQDQN